MSSYRPVLIPILAFAATLLVVFKVDVHNLRPVDVTNSDSISDQQGQSRRLGDDKDAKIISDKSIEMVQETLNLIMHRYELDGIGASFFLTANNVGSNTWDVIKYKFAKKILEKDRFLMTFGGSSVTAGHDNYYNQSYPYVVKRRLGPILKEVGVELLVHDIAQGKKDKQKLLLQNIHRKYNDLTVGIIYFQ